MPVRSQRGLVNALKGRGSKISDGGMTIIRATGEMDDDVARGIAELFGFGPKADETRSLKDYFSEDWPSWWCEVPGQPRCDNAEAFRIAYCAAYRKSQLRLSKVLVPKVEAKAGSKEPRTTRTTVEAVRPPTGRLFGKIKAITDEMEKESNNVWDALQPYFLNLASAASAVAAFDDGKVLTNTQFKDIHNTVELLQSKQEELAAFGLMGTSSPELQEISDAIEALTAGHVLIEDGRGIILDEDHPGANRQAIGQAKKLYTLSFEAGLSKTTPERWALLALAKSLEIGRERFVEFVELEDRSAALGIGQSSSHLRRELQALLGLHAHLLPHMVTFRERAKIWCPEMVVIDPPNKRFMMGAAESEAESLDLERPHHKVVTARKFALGRYTVTFEEYDAYCEAVGIALPDDEDWGRGRMPVINVSWDDAQKYFVWLNEQLGLSPGTCRLPSEAEWEFACRAGTCGPFWTGETIRTDQANYNANYPYGDGAEGEYLGRTVTVDTMPDAVNPWGLAHMHGNVWEWCADHWHDNYEGKDRPDDGRAWSGEGAARMLRGGSWNSLARDLRSANRNWFGTGDRFRFNGFRAARTLRE